MATSSKKVKETKDTPKKVPFGPELGFAATEAYNLLRTNLKFSVTDKQEGKVICITSSIPKEGKSYTSSNLAYALAKSGCKTLLIDADMRKPTIASILEINRTPGLSNKLINPEGHFIRKSILLPTLDVLPAGKTPPNPSELLGSNSFKNLLQEVSKNYEYIIIDLPPVNTVSDAIVASETADGVILVVRHGVTRKSEVLDAIRQFELVKTKILGIVYNAYSVEKGKYYYRKKPYYHYDKYYNYK